MAASDPVPCFYIGQDYRWERPAEIRTRAQVRELRDLKLGEFREGGRIFLFFKRMKEVVKNVFDGPLGIGNLLPFAKPNNLGDKLHYAMPMANDCGMKRHGILGHTRQQDPGPNKLRTHLIHVSGRIAPELRALAAY